MQYISPAILETAYGDKGSGSMSSFFGKTGLSPYAAALAERTTFLILCFLAASKILRVPVAFISWTCAGFSMDFWTLATAARWKIPWMLYSVQILSSRAVSMMEPSMKMAFGFASRFSVRPEYILSRMTGWSPRLRRASAIWEPMNPAPPVTK